MKNKDIEISLDDYTLLLEKCAKENVNPELIIPGYHIHYIIKKEE